MHDKGGMRMVPNFEFYFILKFWCKHTYVHMYRVIYGEIKYIPFICKLLFFCEVSIWLIFWFREVETTLPAIHHKISNIKHTKSQNLNVSRFVLQLSLLAQSIEVRCWEWRCSWSSVDRQCSNYIWVVNNFIAYKGVPYIRDLTVYFLFSLKTFSNN